LSDDLQKLRGAAFLSDEKAESDAIATLSNELEALRDSRSEERFIWVVSAIVAFDSYIFSKMDSWSGPVVIGIIEFLLLVVLARKLGIQEVSQVLAKLLDRAAEVMPGASKEALTKDQDSRSPTSS
jgi:hypothetical protein